MVVVKVPAVLMGVGDSGSISVFGLISTCKPMSTIFYRSDSKESRFFPRHTYTYPIYRCTPLYIILIPPLASFSLPFSSMAHSLVFETLAECGITVDSNDTGNVIHLFPKPNIVITRNGTNDQNPSSSCLRNTLSPTTESPTVPATAHVPQIHIDVSEASRTPAVTSPDIELARYRVRLLCFTLLVYSAMHLLSLFTIFAFSYSNGDESEDDYNKSQPGDPTDTAVGESPFDTTGMVRPWFRGDTYDLFVSLAGFSAATLGLKATIRNISSLARLYFLALLIVGISWLFESLIGIDKSKKEDNSNSTDNEPFDSLDLDDDSNGLGNSSNDFYTNILFAILIPLLIWGLCFYRAWNYQHLLVEAENEARERHLSLLTGSNIGNNRNHGDISDLELQ